MLDKHAITINKINIVNNASLEPTIKRFKIKHKTRASITRLFLQNCKSSAEIGLY